jgi:hypothetical protein
MTFKLVYIHVPPRLLSRTLIVPVVQKHWSSRYHTGYYWVFGLCPSSGSVKNTAFCKLDLFPSSGEGARDTHSVGFVRISQPQSLGLIYIHTLYTICCILLYLDRSLNTHLLFGIYYVYWYRQTGTHPTEVYSSVLIVSLPTVITAVCMP